MGFFALFKLNPRLAGSSWYYIGMSVHVSIPPFISQQPEELKTGFKHQMWSADVAQSNGVNSNHQEDEEQPPGMFFMARLAMSC